MSQSGTWTKVSKALGWLFWLTLGKIGVLIASAIIAASLVDSMSTMEELESAMSTLIAVMWAVFVVEVAVIAALVGYANVPELSGAKGGAIAAVVLAIACLGLDFLSMLPMLARDYDTMAKSSPWETLSSFGKIAFFFVQMGSFRSLANHLGAPEIASAASTCMVLVGVLIGVAIVGGLIVGVSKSEALGILLIVGIVGLAIWAFVLHLLVIFKLSQRTRTEEDVASAFA